MKILTIPHPALTTVSKPISVFDTKLTRFISDLESTLKNKKNPEGVGLSAPQVGKNIRLFSTYLETDSGRQLKSYLNPKITKTSSKLTLGPDPKKPYLEGCLSIPDIYGAVWRHFWVELEYQTLTDQKPQTHRLKFKGFEARVIQHEYDHLEGILFTQRSINDNLPLYKEVGQQLVEIELPQT